MYPPLALASEDKTPELGGNLWSRLSYRIKKLIDSLSLPDPIQRQQIAEQLRSRTTFPDVAWRESGSDLDIARLTCAEFQKIFRWPNGNFVPDDQLQFIAMSADGAFDLWAVVNKLQRQFGCTINFDNVRRATWHGLAVGDFVKELSSSIDRNSVSLPARSQP